ncbi:MAG: hypothetical protein IJ617_02220 [Oscillospiraceae bacterium]|nr:hypothetical protein [Oscillospiraceae bacterium]
MDLKKLSIDGIGLSARASNVLRRAGICTVHDLLQCPEERLRELPSAGIKTTKEIVEQAARYRQLPAGANRPGATPVPADSGLFAWICLPEHQDLALKYAKKHDQDIALLGLSSRARNQLLKNGYTRLSDILFLSEAELYAISAMGKGSVNSVLEWRSSWLQAHRDGLAAAFSGDADSILPSPPKDGELCAQILRLYSKTPFAGLGLRDFSRRLPENAPREQLKRCAGSLQAAGELRYVDSRWYRVYPSFPEALSRCPKLKGQRRELLQQRLRGSTLGELGRVFHMTGEWARQIVKNGIETVRAWQNEACGVSLFAEDYYRYFYAAYSFDRKAIGEWLGLSPAAMVYLDLITVRRGRKDLTEALGDPLLDAEIRQRLLAFYHRDKLLLGGRWIPKKRAALERYAVEHFCVEDTDIEEFRQRYNRFLRELGVDDPDFYLSETEKRGRVNRLADAHFLLWKYGGTMRAYDVDGRDFTELFIALGLDKFENIEISTQKLLNEHPKLLARYDIRDRYELHNLLRKTLPEGSFHDFRLERSPNICFGTFDRDAALFALMADHAPISLPDLVQLIHREYGYDATTVAGTYLTPLAPYYHHGMYSVEQKLMSEKARDALLTALDEDFYYVEQLKQIYTRTVPGADPEEINPYNLKQMGFSTLSQYALRNHSSLDAYFRKLLTAEEQLDITELRRKYTYIQAFAAAVIDLKNTLAVVEYEPNRLISMGRLEQLGVTREDIRNYRDAVYAFAQDGVYFTARSLRLSGFRSALDGCGFGDWFFGSLLLTDRRFSHCSAYKAIVLAKGSHWLTVHGFEEQLIRAAGSISVRELRQELVEAYGCALPSRRDLIHKAKGGGIYFARHLDRLYDSEERFRSETGGAEGDDGREA